MAGAEAISRARQVLAARSKSFALAGRLLGTAERDRAAVVYAFCRRADDAVDLAPEDERAGAVCRLQRELDALCAGEPTGDVVLEAFGEVVRACAIPREYPAELVAGMEMDASGWRYQTLEELMLYCYRVAGTVGLMMCHVLGVRHDRALPRAVHLGLAMQLTNICRDVEEDWQLGRLYLPAELLAGQGAPDLAADLGGPFPAPARRPVARVIEQLLAEADRYYRSADLGIGDLPARAALAVRTARLVYAAIGQRIARGGFDPLSGRAVVPDRQKVLLVGKAVALALTEARSRVAPLALRRGGSARPPGRQLRFGPDVLRIP
jgi:15-cis-phytoene synthase